MVHRWIWLPHPLSLWYSGCIRPGAREGGVEHGQPPRGRYFRSSTTSSDKTHFFSLDGRLETPGSLDLTGDGLTHSSPRSAHAQHFLIQCSSSAIRSMRRLRQRFVRVRRTAPLPRHPLSPLQRVAACQRHPCPCPLAGAGWMPAIGRKGTACVVAVPFCLAHSRPKNAGRSLPRRPQMIKGNTGDSSVLRAPEIGPGHELGGKGGSAASEARVALRLAASALGADGMRAALTWILGKDGGEGWMADGRSRPRRAQRAREPSLSRAAGWKSLAAELDKAAAKRGGVTHHTPSLRRAPVASSPYSTE